MGYDGLETRARTLRRRSRLVLVLLALAWLGGTVALFARAFQLTFCLSGCEPLTDQERLLGHWLVLGSVGCAFVFPTVAVVISLCTDRRVVAGFFLVLGVLPGIAYAGTIGVDAAREINRLTERPPEPLPSNYRPCFSGSSDCTGG